MTLKDIIYLIIIILLLSGGIQQYFSGKAEVSSMAEIIKAKDAEITIWKDKHGQLFFEKLAMEGTVEQLLSVNEQLEGDLNTMHIKVKNLEALVKIKSRTSGTITTTVHDTIIKVDTLEVFAKKFSFADKWLQFAGLLTDSVTIQYAIWNEYDVATHYKGGFLKKKQLTVTIRSLNPNSVITDMQSINVKPPPKPFYESQLFSLGIGLIGGILIAK